MHGEYKVPGGKLVVVDFAVVEGRLVNMQVSGDFFLEPPSALDSIDQALEGLACDATEQMLAAAVSAALAPTAQLFGITPEGVAVAIRRAIDQAPESSDATGTR